MRTRRRKHNESAAEPLTNAHAVCVRTLAWGRLSVALILLIFAGVLIRVVQLKIAPDSRLAEAVGTAMSTRIDLARRGDLLDRRGRVIATSTIGHRLFLDPQEVDDPRTIAVELAQLIDVDPIETDRRIQQRIESRYVVVEHLLEDWQAEAVRQAELPGVGLEPRLVRHYPHDAVGAAVVGLVGFEHAGLAGFEHFFEQKLEPTHGSVSYLRDARRRALWIDPQGFEPAQSGVEVQLSIDLVVQQIAERRLAECVKKHRAAGGRVVVLDCKTGEVLAMADVLSEVRRKGIKIDDPGRKLDIRLARNRCVTDPYEPGSTFKPFVWAQAIELGLATIDEVLPCPTSAQPPYRTHYGRRIRDSHYYGPLTFQRVLVKSVNSGMVMVAHRMTHRQMQQLIWRLGFGRFTDSGLLGESRGIITAPGDWSEYTQSSLSFGHEIAVTPLQMARAFSALARDGTIPALRTTAVTGQRPDYPLVQQVYSHETVQVTRAALRGVMTEGTGRRASSQSYRMFGKSGTPQMPRADGKGYHEDRYVPSFIAAAPLDDPHVVVLCVIEDPDKKVAHYGGDVAGPVVQDVIDGTLGYLGVPSDLTNIDAP
jgi:cell division protein FtsI (penicillin-binding protein 3)